MQIQYAKFTSLVLHGIQSNIPIYPFDVSYGNGGNLGFHYSPDVLIENLSGELGYSFSDYLDNDSRYICCFSCNDTVFTNKPNILIDAVEMGLSAWGGKLMTTAEALSLAQSFQPARSESWIESDPLANSNITKTRTYGLISLDINNLLTRTVTIA